MNTYIVTGPDRLLRLIEDARSISLNQAADQLSVDPDVIQDWSRTLEDAGLILTRATLKETILVSQKAAEPTRFETLLEQMNIFKTTQSVRLMDREEELRQLHKQVREAMKELKAERKEIGQVRRQKEVVRKQESQLRRKEEILKVRADKLADYRGALQERSKEISAIRSDLLTYERSVQKREKSVTGMIAGIEKREKDLARREEQLKQHKQQFKVFAQGLLRTLK